MDVAGRADRLRAGCSTAPACDALLVTNLTNIRYLTGFTGSAALLLVRADELLFVTDGRYRDQAADQLAAAGRRRPTIEIGRTAPSSSDRRWPPPAGGIGRLGPGGRRTSRWAAQRRYADRLVPRTPSWCPPSGLVEALRARQGRRARWPASRPPPRIADAALAAVRPRAGRAADRGRVRARARHGRCAASGAEGAVVRDDRRLRAQRGQAPPPARRPPHRRGRPRRPRLRRPRRRLPLGHDPHRRGRRARRRPSGACSTWWPSARPPGVAAVRGRRRRARTSTRACRDGHRRGRLGRRLPPRHRPRRRPRHPRGPAGGVDVRLLPSPPATSSPSSPASTSPSTAASASRTRSSSPPTAAAP